MDPTALIETYVEDVIARLPRAKRSDVGFELRALLTEELQGRADEAGRPADEAMAFDLLRAFGRPQDVAGRYRPAGHAIVEANMARGFIGLALGGVALQWAVSLLVAFTRPASHVGAPGSAGDNLTQLGRWWVSGGLGALWWPGFMVVAVIFAGWISRRWPDTTPWKPRVLDRDRISRPAVMLGLAAAATGAGVLIFLPWLIGQLFTGSVADNIARALAYDPDFRAERGPWLLPLWAGQTVLYAVLIVRARWTPLLRRIELGFSLAIGALMAWFILGGPIFTAPPADRTVKAVMVAILLLIAIIEGAKLVRGRSRIAAPRVLARPPGA